MFKIKSCFIFSVFMLFAIIGCNLQSSKKNGQIIEDYSGLTEKEIKIEKSIKKIESAMQDLDRAMEKIKK